MSITHKYSLTLQEPAGLAQGAPVRRPDTWQETQLHYSSLREGSNMPLTDWVAPLRPLASVQDEWGLLPNCWLLSWVKLKLSQCLIKHTMKTRQGVKVYLPALLAIQFVLFLPGHFRLIVKELLSRSPAKSGSESQMPRTCPSHKYIFVYECSDFPTVGENIYRNGTAIIEPLTGMNRWCADFWLL